MRWASTRRCPQSSSTSAAARTSATSTGRTISSSRHRANRDLLDCSQITCTIVQALKALGRENVGDEEIRTLARNLTEEQAGAFLEESAGLTSWVADAAKKIWEAKHGQDR